MCNYFNVYGIIVHDYRLSDGCLFFIKSFDLFKLFFSLFSWLLCVACKCDSIVNDVKRFGIVCFLKTVFLYLILY